MRMKRDYGLGAAAFNRTLAHIQQVLRKRKTGTTVGVTASTNVTKKRKKLRTADGLDLVLDRSSVYYLSSQERLELRKLTNSHGSSLMQEYLDTVDEEIIQINIPPEDKHLIAFRAFHKTELVSWALLEPWGNAEKGFLNIFTRPDMRRKGIGLALVRWIQVERPDLYGEPWSSPSYGFFDKLGVNDCYERLSTPKTDVD